MSALTDVEVGELRPDEHEAAAVLLAAAFVTSPIHVAVFGGSDAAIQRKQEAMFRLVVSRLSVSFLAARSEGNLLAVAGRLDWPKCQPTIVEQLRITPAMLWALRGTLSRVASWLGEWGKRDPEASHSHLGPVGVRPDLQGRGLGTKLLERYVAELDRAGDPAYLETDKPENVRLYRRFGFETTHEAEILGVANWFMWRGPR